MHGIPEKVTIFSQSTVVAQEEAGTYTLKYTLVVKINSVWGNTRTVMSLIPSQINLDRWSK